MDCIRVHSHIFHVHVHVHVYSLQWLSTAGLLARNGCAELDRLHHRCVATRATEVLPPPSRQHPRARTPPPRDERREEHDAA